MADRLGYLSLALGATALFAPHAVARALGMRHSAGLLRACGLREVAAGLGILAARDPTPWVWARLAGDVLDLGGLAATADAGRRGTQLALAAVSAVTVMDLLCARGLAARRQSRRCDYSRRSGFPRAPALMRGAAGGQRLLGAPRAQERRGERMTTRDENEPSMHPPPPGTGVIRRPPPETA